MSLFNVGILVFTIAAVPTNGKPCVGPRRCIDPIQSVLRILDVFAIDQESEEVVAIIADTVADVVRTQNDGYFSSRHMILPNGCLLLPCGAIVSVPNEVGNFDLKCSSYEFAVIPADGVELGAGAMLSTLALFPSIGVAGYAQHWNNLPLERVQVAFEAYNDPVCGDELEDFVSRQQMRAKFVRWMLMDFASRTGVKLSCDQISQVIEPEPEGMENMLPIFRSRYYNAIVFQSRDYYHRVQEACQYVVKSRCDPELLLQWAPTLVRLLLSRKFLGLRDLRALASSHQRFAVALGKASNWPDLEQHALFMVGRKNIIKKRHSGSW